MEKEAVRMDEEISFKTKIGSIEDPVERYFSIARERQSIFLKKEKGMSRPWTDDTIFNTFKFCNCFRQQDKVTRWYTENIADRFRNTPALLLATVMFRWFNRIETADLIFYTTLQEWERKTPWDFFLLDGDGQQLAKCIRLFNNSGPFVTGSYTVTSKPGMPKLEGMCSLIEDFAKGAWTFESGVYRNEGMRWHSLANILLNSPGQVRLEEVWNWLRQVPYMGTFHSYEVVTDLRHTALLNQAPDIMTWANAGPGCIRGLNRFFNRDINFRIPKQQVVEEMLQILEYSKDRKYWPNNAEYPAWEMREVEHQNCEEDKYLRVYESNGKRRPRGIYR